MIADGNAAVAREQWHEVYTSEAFAALRGRRSRVGWSLTAVTLVLYVGFFIGVALAPAALGDHVAVFGSVGLLLLVVLFLVAFGLVGGYLGYSGRRLEPAQEQVIAEIMEASQR